MLVCPWACRRHPECRKKPATTITEGLNAAVYQQLDFSDEQETEFARRGLIAAPESLIIKAENGMTIWSQDAYDFVREAEDVPSSANPSLWRNTQHNALYGLFKVTDDIYQVRGYDISNITFVRSQHGSCPLRTNFSTDFCSDYTVFEYNTVNVIIKHRISITVLSVSC